MKKNLKKLLTIMLAVILLMQTGLTSVSAKGWNSSNKNNGKNSSYQTEQSRKGQGKKKQEKKKPSKEEEPVVEEEPVNSNEVEESTTEETIQESIIEEVIEESIDEIVNEESTVEEEAETPVVETGSDAEISDETPEEPEITYPEQSFAEENENGISVSVDAPEGAFPDGTQMSVSEVEIDEAQTLIDASDYAGAEVLAAKDISFEYDGDDIQPNETVLVGMSIADLKGIKSLEDIVVYHIGDDGEVSEVTLDERSTTEMLIFEAAGFSTFTITWAGSGDDDGTTTNLRWRYSGYTYAYVTVHYVNEDGEAITRPSGISENYDIAATYGTSTVEINNTNLAQAIADREYVRAYRVYNNSQQNLTSVGYQYDNNNDRVRFYNGNYIFENVNTGQNINAGDIYLVYTGAASSTGNRVTIHHGIMQNGSFVEFGTNGLPESSNSVYPSGGLDVNDYGTNDNNRYAYLIYDFPGYTYSKTYYRTNESSNPSSGGTEIKAVLMKYNNRWIYRPGNSFNSYVDNGSHIYVVYTPKTITEGQGGSGGGDTPGPSSFTPDVGKSVTDQKSDGTYDITLGFVGDKQPASYAKARVIVVFDRSGSMDDDVSSTDNTERLTVAKKAVNAMAERLLSMTDPDGNKLVEMGLVTFSTDANIETFGNNAQFTSNYNTGNNNTRYKNKIDGISADGGTNWEKALDLANSMAASTDAKTYIVFISDGEPTFRISRGDYPDYNTGSGASMVYGIAAETRDYNTVDQYFYSNTVFGYGSNGNGTNKRCYDAAELVAKSIVEAHKGFYSVGLSSDAPSMKDLAENSGGTYKDGSNSTSFAEGMAAIAGEIEEAVGLSSVTVTDGVTDMTQVQTDALIGTAGDFVYTKSYPLSQNGAGYTYTIGEDTYNVTQAQVDGGSDGTHRIFTRKNSSGTDIIYIEYPWENAPEAELTESNNVVWDTSEANSELEHGVYYAVKFTVWPKQEAYDLIADLDNKKRHVTDAEMTAGIKAQLRILINGTTYEYDTTAGTWTGGLSDAELQALIDAGDPSYSMKTNTGLSAAYEYGGVPGTQTYTNYQNGEMTLVDDTIRIAKYWHNKIDTHSATNVPLTVTKDGVDYLQVWMGEPTQISENEWEQKPATDIYISSGLMSVDSNGNISLKTTGVDYSVNEPQSFSYRWDLSADVYHPMVINTVETMLLLVDEESGVLPRKDASGNPVAIPNEAKTLASNKMVTAGGYDFYRFGEEEKLYVKLSETKTLIADNDRRSNLIINKVVAETGAPEDDTFAIEVTLTNPKDPLPGEEEYDDHYHTMWFYVSTAENDRNTIVMDGVEVEGATPEIASYDDDGNPVYTGFYWFDNGGTATVYLKAGWYLNFNNMGKDTAYSIEELDGEKMPEGYVFDKVTTAAVNKKEGETSTPGTVDTENPMKVTGTIDKPNTDYKATYTNKYLGVFYIYHSSDLTVERYPIAVDGVAYSATKTFDIFSKTADGTLYGGYYSDYAGKSEGFNATEAAKLDYTGEEAPKDSSGKAYSLDYIKTSNKAAWSSASVLTTNGKAIVPEKDNVYYLKEVPTAYLQPYTYYTYFKTNNALADMWAISGLDDLNYSDAGFYVEDVQTHTTDVVSTLSIKAANSSTTVKLTAFKVFNPRFGMKDGYLSYAKISDKIGSKIKIQQYWKTLDGIEVFGVQERSLDTTTRNKATIVSKDSDYPA